jgi:hypothetical protein
MKKALLTVVLIVSICQLKAQNLLQLKPFDTTALDKYFHKQPNSLIKPLTPMYWQQAKPGQPDYLGMFKPAGQGVQLIAQLVAPEKMPVAKFGGYSKMAVVVLPGNSKMPVINLSTGERLDLRKPAVTEDTPPISH